MWMWIIKIIKIKCFYPPRILDEHWCIYSCLQIPPRENWFQYVRRVYETAINFPYITTLNLNTLGSTGVLLQSHMKSAMVSISRTLFINTSLNSAEKSAISVLNIVCTFLFINNKGPDVVISSKPSLRESFVRFTMVLFKFKIFSENYCEISRRFLTWQISHDFLFCFCRKQTTSHFFNRATTIKKSKFLKEKNG